MNNRTWRGEKERPSRKGLCKSISLLITSPSVCMKVPHSKTLPIPHQSPITPPAYCSRALQQLPWSSSGVLWRSAGQCRLASRHHGLSRRQERMCRRYRHLMPHLHTAARHSVDTCQHVFRWHRWNCYSVQFAPGFGRDLTAGESWWMIRLFGMGTAEFGVTL